MFTITIKQRVKKSALFNLIFTWMKIELTLTTILGWPCRFHADSPSGFSLRICSYALTAACAHCAASFPLPILRSIRAANTNFVFFHFGLTVFSSDASDSNFDILRWCKMNSTLIILTPHTLTIAGKCWNHSGSDIFIKKFWNSSQKMRLLLFSNGLHEIKQVRQHNTSKSIHNYQRGKIWNSLKLLLKLNFFSFYFIELIWSVLYAKNE